jgi:uncharacterized membrane protein
MTWRGSTTVSDRIFACLPYLLPLVEGRAFGDSLLRQFSSIKPLFAPLDYLVDIYQMIPFAGMIIFFALYLGVVRNENINHFIRFNAMQAILLDIVLILCSLILSILNQGTQGFIAQTLNNMVFLGVLAAFIYVVAQSALGRYAEIPPLSDAVYMQVR